MVRVAVPKELFDVSTMLLIGESVGGCFVVGDVIAEKSIVPVNPFWAIAVIVRIADEPLAMEVDAGLMVSWKSAAWMVMLFEATGVVWYGL